MKDNVIKKVSSYFKIMFNYLLLLRKILATGQNKRSIQLLKRKLFIFMISKDSLWHLCNYRGR